MVSIINSETKRRASVNMLCGREDVRTTNSIQTASRQGTRRQRANRTKARERGDDTAIIGGVYVSKKVIVWV